MGFWDGSGISWTICKQCAPCSRQITTSTSHHSSFTGRMLFLTSNQQRQSTEDTDQENNRSQHKVTYHDTAGTWVCGSSSLRVVKRRSGGHGGRLDGVTGRQQGVGEVTRLVVVVANTQLTQLGEVHTQQVAAAVHLLPVHTLHANDNATSGHEAASPPDRIRQAAPMCTPHLIHGTFGPHESARQTASGSVDAGLTDVLNTQTDRQTDHETCRECSKKPQCATHAMHANVK